MLVASRLCRAVVGWSCVLAPLVAEGGYREDTVVNVMDKLRTDELDGQKGRLAGLHQSWLNTTTEQEKRIVALGLGYHYVEANPRLAMQYLTSAELACREDDPLLPVIRYYLGMAKLRGGSPAEAAELATELLAREKALPDAWLKLVYSLLIEATAELGDSVKLSATFAEYTKRFSFSRKQETLARLAAQSFEKQGELTKATDVMEEMARGYPATTESRWAFHRLQDLACDDRKSGTKPQYHFSKRLLLHLSRNVLLKTGLEEFLIGAADRPMMLDDGTVRTLWVNEKADFFFRARLYKEALKITRELYEAEKTKPGSPFLPNLVFEMGRIHLRMYEPMLATRFFSKFLFDYPKHPNVARALEYMGDSLRYLDLPLAASESYAAAVQKKDSRQLRWMHFWTTYRGKDYKGALALLEQPGYVMPRDGDDRLTLNYWHARILEKLDKKAEANTMFLDILSNDGDSFYASLIAAIHPELVAKGGQVAVAQADAGKDRGKGMALAARLLSTEAPDVASDAPASPGLKLVDDLFKAGMKDVATIQLHGLNWGQFNQEDAFAAVSKLALNLNDYKPSRSIRYYGFSALRNLPRGWWDLMSHQATFADEWKVYYPLAYGKIVSSVASRIKLNPYLMLSVMRAESYYNKEARSGVGAQGLMQLMPYTAMKIATLLRDENFDMMEVGTPETNIGYGGYYLDKLLRYYGDNPFLAVAAYNGGPVVVNQWLDSCKSCSADEFVDSIAYRETRRYVREVMKNYAHYVRIYQAKQALSELPPMPAELPDGEEIF